MEILYETGAEATAETTKRERERETKESGVRLSARKIGQKCSQQAVAVEFVGGSPPFQKEGVAARPGQALAGKRNVKRAKNTSLYICFVETGLTYKMARVQYFITARGRRIY